MNYGQIYYADLANGPGVRLSLFVSGCMHNCEGCFNKEAQSYLYGDLFTEETVDKIVEEVKRRPYITGFSLLGGEPFQQSEQGTKLLIELVSRLRAETKIESYWVWSGDRMENLIGDLKSLELLLCFDVLVDGPFKEKEKSFSLAWRGSSNQRIINIEESLKNNRIITIQVDE